MTKKSYNLQNENSFVYLNNAAQYRWKRKKDQIERRIQLANKTDNKKK